jgi:hypothetical protein
MPDGVEDKVGDVRILDFSWALSALINTLLQRAEAGC